MERATHHKNYTKLIEKARKTNTRRDAIERNAGFANPHANGPLMLLRAAMQAIEAGISTDGDPKNGGWQCVAEAQAMLEQLHEMLPHPETGRAGLKWDE